MSGAEPEVAALDLALSQAIIRTTRSPDLAEIMLKYLREESWDVRPAHSPNLTSAMMAVDTLAARIKGELWSNPKSQELVCQGVLLAKDALIETAKDRTVFEPARAPGPIPRILWMHTHCSHVEVMPTANTPPGLCPACEEDDEPWALLYVRTKNGEVQP